MKIVQVIYLQPIVIDVAPKRVRLCEPERTWRAVSRDVIVIILPSLCTACVFNSSQLAVNRLADTKEK